MATAEARSYIDQVKEMRAIRMQQFKQMSAEQRYQNTMVNYQRTMIRNNERIISSLANLGNKITSTVTGLVSAIGKTGGAAAGAAASGVSNLSSSITSGLGKVLPLAIAGLLGKVLLWDNMSGDTQKRLSGAIGGLFGKLFSSVESMFDGLMAGILNTVESVKKSFKSLNVEFPFFETLFKKAGIVFKIIVEGLKYVTSYIKELVDFVKENPMASAGIAAAGYLSPQIIGTVASLASSVLSYMVMRGLLTRHMNQLLATSATQLGTRLALEGGAGAGGRALSTRLGAAGSAALGEKFGVDLAEHVYMGEGGQPILGPDGKPMARVAPELTKGQRVMSGIRTFASKSLQIGARMLSIAGTALMAVEPQGGWTGAEERDYEQFELDIQRTSVLTSLANRTRGYTLTKYPNMLRIFMQAAVDSFNERIGRSGAVYPGDVLIMSNRFVWRARGKDEKDPFKRTSPLSVFTIKVDGQDMTIIEMIPVDRAMFERDLEKEANEIEAKTQNQMSEIDRYVNPNKGETKKPNLTTSGTNLAGLAKIIQKYESAPAGYEQLFLNSQTGKPFVETSKPLTQMSVAEIRQVQKEQVAKTKAAGIGIDPKTGKPRGTGAIGKYQFTETTLAELLSSLGIKEDAIFDEALQDRLFVKLIGDRYIEYLQGHLTKEQFLAILQGTWEGFRSEKAVKELNKFLGEVKSSYKGETDLVEGAVVVDEKGRRITGGELIRKKAEEKINKLLKELDETEDLLDKPLVTIKGESVVGNIVNKAKDYISDREKRIKEITDSMKKVDPEEIKNDLLDTLKIINEVNQAKGSDKRSSAGDIINNYNIDNSVVSSGGYGGTGSVYPVRYRNDYEHTTLSGISRLT